MTVKTIVRRINENLKESGWYDQLRIFLESSDFSDIIKELIRKVEEDKQRFCPALNTAFRFLQEVPFDNIQTVIFTDYTCNRLEQADGIPFSYTRYLYDKTPGRLYNSIDDKYHHVSKWVKQGVLIVPLSLTSRLEGRSHKQLWMPFIMRLIEAINTKYNSVPWILIGSDTFQYYEDIKSPYIRDFELSAPDKEWSKWANEILLEQEKAPIVW